MYDFVILKVMNVFINSYASYCDVFSFSVTYPFQPDLSKVRLTEFITGTDSQIEPKSNPWDAGFYKISVNVL